MAKVDILLKHLSMHLRFHGMDYQEAFNNLENDLAELKHRPSACKPLPILFNRETGEFFGIIADHRSLWKKAYPAVDLEGELARAAAWLMANPKKAPRSNYSRFLTGWLSRTQDRGGTRGLVASNRPAIEDKAEAWAKSSQ